MKYIRPGKILAGFHASVPDKRVPELVHVGEQWAPVDYEIPRHAHVVWEFYLQIDGFSQWEDSTSCRYTCRPGAFFAPPPGLEHWLVKTGRDKHHFFFAALDLDRVFRSRLPHLKKLWPRGRCAYFAYGRTVEAPFRQLVREVMAERPLRTQGLRAAVDYLVIEASRLFLSSAGKADGQLLVPMHPAVEQARQLLDLHYSEPWALADLSRMVGVSPSYLVQLFTAELGISPHQYLLRQRIARAKEMLRHSDMLITDLALELGFNSSQHFARTFRQMVKCSARRFRQRHRSKSENERRPSNRKR